jgi:hypothetical protein
MARTTIACLAVLCIAGVVSAQLGGRESGGVIAGVLCGSSVSMLGASWVRHNFAHRPKRAFNAVIETFLFKMAFVMLGALSFRYIEAAAARADWKVFLLAFVATAFIIQTVSVIESVRLLRPRSDQSETPSPTHGEPQLASSQAE